MYTQNLSLAKLLSRGLSPHDYASKSDLYLESCHNLEPYEQGVRKHQLPTRYSLLGGVTYPYPLPYRVKNTEGLYLFDSTEIKRVGAIAISTLSDIDGGGSITYTDIKDTFWKFVDFGIARFWFNGDGEIIFTFLNKSLVETWYYKDNSFGTGCEHKGRLLVGNLPNLFWYVYKRDANSISHALDYSDWVMWSSIGGGDVLYWLDSDETMSDDFSRELLLRNEFGYAPIPYGTILWMHELGENVAVYSKSGITILHPHSQPVPTYGVTPVRSVSIPSKHCVGGDEYEHVFIDVDGALWKHTAQGLDRLGFNTFFSPFVTSAEIWSTVKIMVESKSRVFYITNGSSTYGLTKDNKLFSLGYHPTGVFSYNSRDYIYCYSDSGDIYYEVITPQINFGLPGLKTLKSINTVGEFDTLTTIPTVNFRTTINQSEDNYTSNSVFHSAGSAFFNKTGMDFAIKLKEANVGGSKQFDLIDLNVDFQVGDLRFIRREY